MVQVAHLGPEASMGGGGGINLCDKNFITRIAQEACPEGFWKVHASSYDSIGLGI